MYLNPKPMDVGNPWSSYMEGVLEQLFPFIPKIVRRGLDLVRGF